MQQFVDGIELNNIFTCGYLNLKKNVDGINDLNVFPVPDGDTGTNMEKTFGAGLASVSDNCKDVSEYMEKLSKAVLLSARGNSGVIFSQFIHGLYRGFKGKESIEFSDFSLGFSCAKEDSYSAIMTPVEGTMLTIIREADEFLKENANSFSGFESGFSALIKQMKKSLANTPELLPVLKEAGVVDSGGAGLLCFVEGMYAGICHESIEDIGDVTEFGTASLNTEFDFGPDSVLEYGYCTEFVLQLLNKKTNISEFEIEDFKKPLAEMGDSIVVVNSDSIVKVHIHTFTPERVLEYGRKFGEFVSVKIENMSVQHSEVQSQTKKEKLKYAIVTVASGEGIIDYFYSIGANVVINAGQTNNPPVNQFLDAFNSLDAEYIIVLPNNSNIIFTANQAAEMHKDNNVFVIPTRSVVEGYSALSMMNPCCGTVEELIADMSSGLKNATTAYVTRAVRDAVLNGTKVAKNEYLGLENKNLISNGADRLETAIELIDRIVEKTPKEVIIVFCGDGVSMEEADQLESTLRQKYPANDIGFIDGKQSVYDYIISLE